MLVTYNSILNITALLPNLNATAPKNPVWKLEQRCSISADTVGNSSPLKNIYQFINGWTLETTLEVGAFLMERFKSQNNNTKPTLYMK